MIRNKFIIEFRNSNWRRSFEQYSLFIQCFEFGKSNLNSTIRKLFHFDKISTSKLNRITNASLNELVRDSHVLVKQLVKMWCDVNVMNTKSSSIIIITHLKRTIARMAIKWFHSFLNCLHIYNDLLFCWPFLWMLEKHILNNTCEREGERETGKGGQAENSI